MVNIPFFSNKKIERENYFGLLLKENEGVALVMVTDGRSGKIRDYQRFKYSNGWESITEDVDEALFQLENRLKLRLEKTIFFIFSHLIDEKTGQIKTVFQTKIKSLVKGLDLKPLGFIECREAVTKILEDREGLKLTAILVEINKTVFNLYVYKAGNVAYAKSSARTESLVDDLNAILTEIKEKVLLPARIVLYNSQDLDNELTNIINYRWSDEVFIQLPKVTLIRESELLTGLVNIFFSQITQNKIADETQSSTTVAGFLIGEDIKEKETQPPLDKRPFPVETTSQPFTAVSNADKKFKIPRLPALHLNISKNILVIIGLTVIGVSLLLNEFYFHTGQLKIYLPSQTIEKDLTMKVATSGKADLIVREADQSFTLTETIAASGKKDIGETARGEITIYNFSKERIFTKGTTIEAKGLRFLLDDDVKVASASLTSDGSAKLPGKNKVRVTAAQIGTESNLEKGVTFKIEDLDPEVYFAKNETAFSGGSKKQVTIVTKTDQEELRNIIIKKANSQKQPKLKLSDDERIINPMTTLELTWLDFSKKIGEEAESVSLKAEVKTKYYIYSKKQLLNYLLNVLDKEVKKDYQLSENRINYFIDKAEKLDSGNLIKLQIKAKAVKKIDNNLLYKSIIGRSKHDLHTIIKQKFAIEAMDIKIRQPMNIFPIKDRLPWLQKNIVIVFDTL